jgi:hypothetical protein
MARSITTIYNEILTIKDQQAELAGLTSTSNTAIFKLLFYVHAVAINIHEQLWDLFKEDLEYIKATAPVMSEAWWIDKLKNFYQYDNLDTDKGVLKINDSFVPYYETTDETKRIVKFAAVKQTENSRQVNIKVAKADVNGNPIQFSNDELLSIKSFVNSVQSAGLYLNVISFPPDDLKLNINIYFDGQYIQTNVLANVKTAIRNYLQNLNLTKFDGTVQLIKLVDAIQGVEGVKDVLINSAYGKGEAEAYTLFNRVYNAKAGYASLDEANSVFTMIIEK